MKQQKTALFGAKWEKNHMALRVHKYHRLNWQTFGIDNIYNVALNRECRCHSVVYPSKKYQKQSESREDQAQMIMVNKKPLVNQEDLFFSNDTAAVLYHFAHIPNCVASK